MILSICAGLLIVLGIVSLVCALESGVRLVIGVGLLIVDDKQRKRKLTNG